MAHWSRVTHENAGETGKSDRVEFPLTCDRFICVFVRHSFRRAFRVSQNVVGRIGSKNEVTQTENMPIPASSEVVQKLPTDVQQCSKSCFGRRELADVGPIWKTRDQHWSSLTEHWTTLGRFGQHLAQMWTTQMLPKAAQTRRTVRST